MADLGFTHFYVAFNIICKNLLIHKSIIFSLLILYVYMCVSICMYVCMHKDLFYLQLDEIKRSPCRLGGRA